MSEVRVEQHELEMIKKTVLTSSRKLLVDSLDPTSHISYLRSKFVFDERDAEEINAPASRSAKAEVFLDKLSRKGPLAYDEFENSLCRDRTQLFLLTHMTTTLELVKHKVREYKERQAKQYQQQQQQQPPPHQQQQQPPPHQQQQQPPPHQQQQQQQQPPPHQQQQQPPHHQQQQQLNGFRSPCLRQQHYAAPLGCSQHPPHYQSPPQYTVPPPHARAHPHPHHPHYPHLLQNSPLYRSRDPEQGMTSNDTSQLIDDAAGQHNEQGSPNHYPLQIEHRDLENGTNPVHNMQPELADPHETPCGQPV